MRVVAVLLGLFLVIVEKSQARSIPEQLQTEEFLHYMNRMSQLGRKCGEELGPVVVRNLPDITGLLQYPEDNDSLNALWGCAFKKRGIVDEESNIDNTELKRYVWEIFIAAGNTDPSYQIAARDLVTFCSSLKGEDYGQTAVKLQNCVVQYLFERNLRK